MKLSYDHEFKTLTGEPYTDEKGAPMTLRSAIILAASLPLPGDDQLSLMDKVQIGQIGIAAHKGLDLAVEQVSRIKDRIGKVIGSPVLVVMITDALEGVAASE